MSKLVVSFSVYGDDSIYSSGAIANAIAVKQFFPGWIARFYVEDSVAQDLRNRLRELGAEVVEMQRKGNVDGLFWRFLAAGDPGVGAVIVRDVDALLCPRDKFVVDEWLLSRKGFHIIRDHPSHQHLILGGLWGAKGGILPNISDLIDGYMRGMSSDEYGADIIFLSRVVYPLILSNSFIHSDFVAFAEELVNPIAVRRRYSQWLGFPPARGKLSEARQIDFKSSEGQGLKRYAMSQCIFG